MLKLNLPFPQSPGTTPPFLDRNNVLRGKDMREDEEAGVILK